MEELVKKARAGDSTAEKQLFEKLLVRFQYLAKLKIGENNSEDLAQEACITVFEKYKDESFTVGFLPWAHGVLKMKTGNYLQKKKRLADRQQEIGEDADFVDRDAVDPDLKRFLMECLSKLKKAGGNYARILNLSHQGFSTNDICDRLGIRANSYYVALSRGRVMLRDCLESKGVVA
jgi:RNA polymerase sigma-70 factor, ECF subfamily